METKLDKATDKEGKIARRNCPVCCSSRTTVFFKVESAPVFCNVLWDSREEAISAPRAPIDLAYCDKCGLIYNVSFDPKLTEYCTTYENSLHFSPHFQEYARDTASQLIQKYQLHGKDIIEIGCGRGDFLEMLKKLGDNRVIGFDPSYNSEGESYDSTRPAVKIIPEVYSEVYDDYPADFICCRHVLEHIDNPLEFLTKVRKAINGRHRCVVYFEVPNVLYTIGDMGVWDIIYEHCCYFTSQSLTKLFVRADFKPTEVAEHYGGQFLSIEARPSRTNTSSISKYKPVLQNITSMIRNFSNAYQEKLDLWQRRLSRLRKEKKRVVLWGAGSKGITFLNALNISHNWIEYIVDLNSRKHGRFVAGTGQEVIAPDSLKDYKPQIVIIMNPIYHTEIKQMIKELDINAELITA